jgi:chromate transport protein ChrA
VLIDVVLVAALLATAIGYVRKGSIKLPRVAIVCGAVLATVSFVVPLVLNHVMVSDFLHRFHKLLAFVSAFVVFVTWIAALRYRSRRRSSKIRANT